jgi:TM2 domain-containing membrane protein YozV
MQSHSPLIGYILWIFGFTGSHRFYFGRPISGSIWFATFGLLGIGWLIDLFLIPGMARTASRKFHPGRLNYDVAWILLTFLGYLGVHRFYMGKWVTGIIYFCTAGLFFCGYFYDMCTINNQIDEINSNSVSSQPRYA